MLIMLPPIWWAASSVVPRRATVMENSRKPMRKHTCSTKELDHTLPMELRLCFSGTQPLKARRLIKLSLRSTEAILKAQAHTVPSTVARAAPSTPSSGKPKLPPMSR